MMRKDADIFLGLLFEIVDSLMQRSYWHKSRIFFLRIDELQGVAAKDCRFVEVFDV